MCELHPAVPREEAAPARVCVGTGHPKLFRNPCFSLQAADCVWVRVESSSFTVEAGTRSQPALVSPQAGEFTRQREEKGWYLQLQS